MRPLLALARDPPVALSLAALLAANLVPLLGVLLLGWRLGEVLALYWLENVVIGVFTLVKMTWTRRLSTLFFGPFFVFHYGLFTLVHGLFVYVLFVAPDGLEPAALGRELIVPMALLAASHAVSFVAHFVRGSEGKSATPDRLMAAPYPRVIVLHVTVIAGGFLVLLTGERIAAVALLVVLKSGVDIAGHLRERRQARA